MTELERYKEALMVAREELARKERHNSQISCEAASRQTLIRIADILNPPQEFEEVPVVRWHCTTCGETEDHSYDICSQGHNTIAKLTGTIRRAAPQKVERSVSVEVEVDNFGISQPEGGGYEWKAYPECHGKRGLLTFTWTE